YMDYPYTEKAFTGKINGNNYKLYGECGWPIFGYIKGAEICNFVLSTELHNSRLAYALFCYVAENSSIKNITNYAYMGGAKGDNWVVSLGGLICLIADCTVENVVNYSDVTGDAAIIQNAYNSTVRNCKNYGNISVDLESRVVGAVVSVIWSDRYEVPTVGSIVEGCENYGNIIGANYIGGIVGRVELFNDALTIGYVSSKYFTDLGCVELAQNPSVIRNCKNFGNIYRNKDYRKKVTNSPLSNTVICCFGGIAGLGYQIENCTNSGNVYGFEVIHPEYTVDYIGGVAGAACTVTDCTSSTKLVASNTIEHTDDICGYLIEK
ncbi:MAG: hypothetical protein HDT28_09775, partial [Clostridiales bacterium]|nr:hypothetical protein [Clostridiales bacterium]